MRPILIHTKKENETPLSVRFQRCIGYQKKV